MIDGGAPAHHAVAVKPSSLDEKASPSDEGKAAEKNKATLNKTAQAGAAGGTVGTPGAAAAHGSEHGMLYAGTGSLVAVVVSVVAARAYHSWHRAGVPRKAAKVPNGL